MLMRGAAARRGGGAQDNGHSGSVFPINAAPPSPRVAASGVLLRAPPRYLLLRPRLLRLRICQRFAPRCYVDI